MLQTLVTLQRLIALAMLQTQTPAVPVPFVGFFGRAHEASAALPEARLRSGAGAHKRPVL